MTDEEDFVARYGGLYEHSPWVALRTWPRGPFRDRDALADAMQSTMLAASLEEKMALIRAHPELAGKLDVARLTESSRAEQASAGLDRVTPEQKARMQALNAAYREKFGFPFIVAVRGLDWSGIIARMETRLANDREGEVATALEQVGRIARLRLEALPWP